MIPSGYRWYPDNHSIRTSAAPVPSSRGTTDPPGDPGTHP
ncbi:hypothetical protein EBESD8_18300 [Rhodococcus aetherivorans]|nr:hypothetical protein EBESD8_18300 [Rhodococcus aetherivorans]